MENDFITFFGSFGAVGFICFTLFKKLLNDVESDKQYYRSEIEKAQNVYREELKNDRQVYQETMNSVADSINSVVNRLENVEQDITEIKGIIKK